MKRRPNLNIIHVRYFCSIWNASRYLFLVASDSVLAEEFLWIMKKVFRSSFSFAFFLFSRWKIAPSQRFFEKSILFFLVEIIEKSFVKNWKTLVGDSLVTHTSSERVIFKCHSGGEKQPSLGSLFGPFFCVFIFFNMKICWNSSANRSAEYL